MKTVDRRISATCVARYPYLGKVDQFDIGRESSKTFVALDNLTNRYIYFVAEVTATGGLYTKVTKVVDTKTWVATRFLVKYARLGVELGHALRCEGLLNAN